MIRWRCKGCGAEEFQPDSPARRRCACGRKMVRKKSLGKMAVAIIRGGR